MRRFHEANYSPSQAALIVVGDVTADSAVKALEGAFGKWAAAAQPTPPPQTEPPQLTTRQVYLVDKPGAPQSQIRIGRVGVPRSTPDYFPLQAINTVLGGAFSSRLNLNLREKHGYSYGAASGFEMRKQAGPFYATAGVQADKTSESLSEFFKELDGIRMPVTQEELARAKNYLALRFPRRFESIADIASQLEAVIIYKLPEDYFNTFVSKVEAVTAADVERVAKQYIQPERFIVVVVGDVKSIEPRVAALNLGPMKIVPLDDVMPK